MKLINIIKNNNFIYAVYEMNDGLYKYIPLLHEKNISLMKIVQFIILLYGSFNHTYLLNSENNELGKYYKIYNNVFGEEFCEKIIKQNQQFLVYRQ